ncbi:MAG TPA: UDP-glucose/GDP-mannose dehydrogenase family protein [Dehalococcoidia bacterium]
MSNICVVGAGYVGLVTAGCFARLGHQVTCVDVNPQRVEDVNRDRLPVREPHLDALWRRSRRQGRLRATTDYARAVPGAAFIFVCVDTPAGGDGRADLRRVVEAAGSIAAHLPAGAAPVVALKSTVPVGTAELVRDVLAACRPAGPVPPVVSNPEFLREGHAVSDFLRPARVVVGAADEAAARAVAALYEPLRRPVLFCDNRTAELIKYASNAFLATKVSFINEIAELCESYGVDVTDVARAIGMDARIGGAYLDAGLGWGGSCLPKDLAALVAMAGAREVASPLLSAVVEVNRRQPQRVVQRLRDLLGSLDGRTVAVWGLTFKPDCNDLRGSQALALIRLLEEQGCRVRAYDPAGMPAAAPLLPGVALAPDAYEAAAGADAVVLATAWAEFRSLDFVRVAGLVRRPLLIDGRNCLPVEAVLGAGFTYIGMGRHAEPVRPVEVGVPPELRELAFPAAPSRPGRRLS